MSDTKSKEEIQSLIEKAELLSSQILLNCINQRVETLQARTDAMVEEKETADKERDFHKLEKEEWIQKIASQSKYLETTKTRELALKENNESLKALAEYHRKTKDRILESLKEIDSKSIKEILNERS